MYPRHDVMHNAYSGPTNASPIATNAPFPFYHNMRGRAPAMKGSTMMCMYEAASTAGGPPAGSGGGRGKRVDPNMADPCEYNDISNSAEKNRGHGRRWGGGYNGTSAPPCSSDLFHCDGLGYGFSSFNPPKLSDYEAHDSQVKAPVVVTMETVVPTVGSNRLFSRPPKPIVYGSPNVVRICDAFQEGRCLAGDRCRDIHVKPEFLAETRMQMCAWLTDRESEFNQTLQTNPTKTFRIFVADLKEVVEVPVKSVVFTKGLCVDPVTRARRARGAGTYDHTQNHTVMQIPTSCGLYSADSTQCKWGRWCNQVHIDHKWMQSKKDEFDHWFDELQARYFSLAPDDKFTVLDPHLKMSICLPKFSIASFSRGLFQGSVKKLASVCLLYQRAKCTAGSRCNQIHVMPVYLNLAREYATLEHLPGTSVMEKQRLAHEMEMLRGPCVERQKREQQEAEKAAAEAATAKLALSKQLFEQQPGHMNSNSGNVEEELGLSGALFEHVQADADTEPISLPVSSNTSLTRRLNTSAPDLNLPVGRHMNSDGSYSFNPYGSFTSLSDASVPYGRAPAGRSTNSLNMENNSVLQCTPGSVHLHATGMKGGRRLVAVISPEMSSSSNDVYRTEEMGNSITVDGCTPTSVVEGHMHSPVLLRACGSGRTHHAAMNYRSSGDCAVDGSAANEAGNSPHPMYFDAGLYFT
ncbi:hypothetical protein ABL78_1648 [Leptomonas seymouri]|uniref:C3H1-type domain-containing protein n=1 Tax=Leptomonas seymouri TaxID=5684 RepID=A0A0N1PDN9_LEPSE|nr:hypothetical protein ABL78_1648 [Leptomonas seymouri]|eukprot:KPI89225.1 hypothetical protein ABL78_1648 [Leptomonas seymouri]